MLLRHSLTSLIAALVAGTAIAAPAQADSVADFFSGKVIRFIVPAGTGGGYDLYMRTLAQYMGSHIPGNPSTVIVNMPGAGGVKATNYIYNAAPRDGTAIGMPFFNLPMFQLIRPQGIKFDARKLGWIGNMAELNDVIVVMASTGVKTINDAKKRQVVLAASGKGSETYMYPQLCNALLGTKFKLVLGYMGTAAMSVAMERGEVMGRAGSWQAWPVTRPEWIREGKINELVQAGLRRDPGIPNVPLITDLVAPADKPLAKFVSSAVTIARPPIAPPDLPAARLKALRDAFMATMKDPAFLADAKKRRMDLRVMSGQQVTEVIEDLFRTPKAVVKKARDVLGY